MTTIDQERLANLPLLTPGNHRSPQSGMSLLEAISWVTHEPFSVRPRCVPTDLATYLERISDEAPQWVCDELVERIPAIVAARDEDAGRRALVAVDWVVRRALPLAFEAHDEDDVAGLLRALSPITDRESLLAATRLTLRVSNLAYDRGLTCAYSAAHWSNLVTLFAESPSDPARYGWLIGIRETPPIITGTAAAALCAVFREVTSANRYPDSDSVWLLASSGCLDAMLAVGGGST